jgi:Putative adhesin
MTESMPMTRARRVILILGVPVAFAVLAAGACNAAAQTYQVGYRVHLSVPPGGQRAGVAIDNANASVHPGAGSRIVVDGMLRGSLARPAFSWRPTAAGLALRSSCRLGFIGSCTMAYDIAVPGRVPVTVTDATGDLTVTALRGEITLSDGSGDITASGLTGSVSLSDDSGDITVTGLAGTDVTGAEGSGDIALEFTRVPRRVDVTAETGDITLILPRGPTAYQVHASSASGDVSDGLNQQPSSPCVIVASSGSGDVSIGY